MLRDMYRRPEPACSRRRTARWAGCVAAVLMALPGASDAGESAVQRLKPWGVGFAVGFPSTLTVKGYVSPRDALTGHLGPTLGVNGLTLRGQYEMKVADLAQFKFGDLVFGWQVGASVNLLFGQVVSDQPVRFGVLAGVHVQLRLNAVPLGLYAEVSPTLYPLDLLPGASFLPASVVLCVGARWYFGNRKVIRVSLPEALEQPSQEPPEL